MIELISPERLAIIKSEFHEFCNSLSQRDMCILRSYILERLTQQEIARRHRLASARVSQILGRIKKQWWQRYEG